MCLQSKRIFALLMLIVYFCANAFGNAPASLLAVLPFEQEPGKDGIILHLKLNNSDKVLRFLFDSGADGMAISADLAKEIGLKVTRRQNTSVVGSMMQITISSGNTVHLGRLKLINQNIAIFDKLHDSIDGLIGLNLAKKYIVNVNFDEKNMRLYSFGTYEYDPQGKTEAITLSKVIHIQGYINLTGEKAVEGKFVFDTGADYFFMGFSPFVRKNRLLLSGFKPESQSATMSMGIVTPVYEGKALEFGVGKTIKQTNMPVSLQASSGNSNWQPNVDGSVGVKLISQYNFTINLPKNEVHFSPRK